MLPNITNNLALNFCNSQIVRHGKIIELILSLEGLNEWSEIPIDNQQEYNKQLSVFNSLIDQSINLDELIDFRNQTQLLLKRIINKEKTVEDLTFLIETFLVDYPFGIVFVGTTPLYVPVVSGLNGIKSLVYLSLADMIQKGDIDYLHACHNELCPLIYINRTGKRKWCSMRICGNRNKVEKYLNKNS